MNAAGAEIGGSVGYVVRAWVYNTLCNTSVIRTLRLGALHSSLPFALHNGPNTFVYEADLGIGKHSWSKQHDDKPK
jgi:hypothetical protein